MSDNGEVEVETVSGFKVLPKDVVDEVGTIKLLYGRAIKSSVAPL